MNAEVKKQRRGFACMSVEKRTAIAAKGGAAVPASKRSFSRSPELAERAGRKGGSISHGDGSDTSHRLPLLLSMLRTPQTLADLQAALGVSYGALAGLMATLREKGLTHRIDTGPRVGAGAKAIYVLTETAQQAA